MADDDRHRTGGQVKERVQGETKEPALYSVVLLNDDYTPMQFVMDLVESVFQKTPAEAYRITMQVHLNGKGMAGVYPWEVAETKVAQTIEFARRHQHPLQCTMEKE